MIALYSILLYALQPLIGLRLLWRSFKTPAYRQRWRERYGWIKGPAVLQGIVIHAVSVGEVRAALPLIHAVRQRYPTLAITVTTTTPTGSEQVRLALGDAVYHVYLPYDLPSAINRFLDRIQPRLMIIMETELWPHLTHVLYRRHIPLIIANARLSERSARGYRQLGALMRTLLQRITLVAARDQHDADRFLSLGLAKKQLAVMGDMKAEVSVTATLLAQITALKQQWLLQRPIWIAASTHHGEEEIVLEVHQHLLRLFPNLLLLLFPRHPERLVKVQRLIEQRGLNYITRSSAQYPQSETAVVIGDTLGELMLFYGISDIAFIGGSLIPHGGHNPLEPAAHALPLLIGPHYFNFTATVEALQVARGLTIVNDGAALAQQVSHLLSDEAERRQQGRGAQQLLLQNQGALARLLSLLQPYLPSLALKHSSGEQDA